MTKQIFKNKKVVIMGLGLHGGGVDSAKFFYKQGASVLVTDLKTEEQLGESIKKLRSFKKIEYALGGHREDDFKTADLIIKNPDVPGHSPYLEIARQSNIEIQSDVGLFFKLSGAFIIGVTGSKGKSTTASLIFHLLRSKYKKIFLAGNIGVSPLSLLAKVKKGDKVVLELSSFELDDLNQSPNIAVVTNIMPDHLNRYADMSEYVNSKKRIFKFQGKKDILVLNGDDAVVRNFAAEATSRVCYFSKESKPENINLEGFKLYGNHNLSNLLAAIEVARIMKIPEKVIEKNIKTFKGVHSRQEFIREINGVKYFNDTTATIPEAVTSAIDSFSDRFRGANIFLICGGVYKGVDYRRMTERIRDKKVSLILLPGNASDKIKEKLPGYNRIAEVDNMREAVDKASKMARAGDLVILSPAASSFNIFKNEFDRGDQFNKFVKKLK